MLHVYSSREVKILVEKISMSIFFSGPCPCPNCPRSKACTSLIPNTTIKGVKHCLVSWEGFFSNHVSNQHDKKIIREFPCSFPQFLDLLIKSIRLRFWKKILWLPTTLNRF
ncbi:hypothetical protein OIU77_013710 [Salix suchowensis]|uniref:Uncharacterized protein n=1 Tax=Salix suchowensis TaxID=1278906 RepID=A0ABQ8ZV72_9ROSI|nr:hypothetical protein OIU77_013710 [Salix suchowensis]